MLNGNLFLTIIFRLNLLKSMLSSLIVLQLVLIPQDLWLVLQRTDLIHQQPVKLEHTGLQLHQKHLLLLHLKPLLLDPQDHSE